MNKYKVFFLGLIFTPIRRCFKINEKLWVFGSDLGEGYGQNSKYLFEYILSEHKEIDAYWITKSKLIYKMLLERNIPVLYNYSIKGIYYSLTAKVKVVSTWFTDIDYTLKDKRQYVAYLEHGMPIKKVFYDYISKDHKTIYKKITASINNYFTVNYKLEDSCFTPVTSEFYKDILSKAMRNNNVYVCGQPRNDAFSSMDSRIIKNHLGIGSDFRIISYLPTHRSYGKGEPSPHLFINNEQAITYFTENKIKVVWKQHPNMLSKYNLENARDCFLDLSFDRSVDTQELLYVSDILITDFSSCFIDYLSLGRPVLFYNYDNYQNTDNDLYLSIDDLSEIGDMVDNENDLFGLIEEKMAHKTNNKKDSLLLNKFKDFHSCERAFSILKQIAYPLNTSFSHK